MHSDHKVSIIMPSYNRGDLISKTIENVLEQTYKNFELLIIDDGSTDNTAEIIHPYLIDERIKYYYQHNAGACVARNHGMRQASGRFMMFMDSDDLMVPTKLEVQISALLRTQASCAICDFEYIDETGNSLRIEKNDGNIHEYVMNFRSPFIMSVLIDVKSIPKNFGWNKQILRNQDMDFLFRYFCLIDDWVYTPGVFCLYLQHGQERISDTYSMGFQFEELKQSMQNFLTEYVDAIPFHNKDVINHYIDKLEALRYSGFMRQYRNLFDQVTALKDMDSKYVIYGNGTIGKTIHALLDDQIIAFVDQKSDSTAGFGTETGVFPPENLRTIEYDKVIISAIGHEKSIERYLVNELGVEHNKIIKLIL